MTLLISERETHVCCRVSVSPFLFSTNFGIYLFSFKANEMSSSKLKNSSHSLSSQVSLTSPQQPAALAVSPTASAQSIKLKQRKSDLSSPSPPVMADVGPAANQQQPCSLAIPITSSFSKPPNKQGFRFSLRRMLYNSPLVSQRRARSLSTSTQAPTAGTSGGSGSTSDSKKKQSPSLCKHKAAHLLFILNVTIFHVFSPFRV